ncbi:hypothetical protein C8R48DRAFT_775022 [Suillus tomentosus]|nr:hypothetical protein C8R48DRAFT_775022 [Suillus tomentosus]
MQEDIAYSLFGIFGVHLPVIYGEKKQNALGRLLQEIVARSGDITSLDSSIFTYSFQAYASILWLVSVTTKPQWSRLVSNHLATLLFAVFPVFTYRDLWPLVTFSKQPKDIEEGGLLWAKVIILFLSSIAFPLVSPRQYVPVDPANPADSPHPEQTSSWLSMVLYIWLDPIVFKAYREPQKKSFPHLDPFFGSRRRHIFFGLMKTFCVEYIVLSIMIVLQFPITSAGKTRRSCWNQSTFALCGNKRRACCSPSMGLDILAVLRTTCGCLGMAMTRVLVQTEGIITQLVFEHALRIRMKAELPDGKRSGESTPSSTPDSASVAGSSTAAADESTDGSGDETLQASTETASTSSTKKDKRKSQDVKEEMDNSSKQHSSADNLVGKINNLVTDLSNLTDGRDFTCVVHATSSRHVYLVLVRNSWLEVGIVKLLSNLTDGRLPSAFAGLVVMSILFPLPGYVIPLFTMMASYMTFTLIMGQTLTCQCMGCVDLTGIPASKVFSSMTIFDILRDQLNMVFFSIPRFTQSNYFVCSEITYKRRFPAKVSLDRVNSFLSDTELLNAHAQQDDDRVQLFVQSEGESDLIGFRDAVFAWSNDSRGSLTPSKRKFRLRIDGEMYFQRGCFNLVVGPTGSGKTSMLMALLGEMHFTPSGPTSWFNLPRKGGVAYAVQESWVQNETIRANILFGGPYDEIRYKKVLYQCALERDLTLFEAGDQTEVGEKGLTLSGGQKARITLARAIYSSANTLLLDDVLAALDVHTSKWIVDKCFAGDLVQDRTIILVAVQTHNVDMASSIAHFVVSMGSNGRIVSHGSISEAIAKDGKLAAEMAKEQEVLAKDAQVVDTLEEPKAKSDGKLVMSEEIAVGHVSWPAFKLYLTGLGGNYPITFWVVFLALMGLTDFVNTVQTWFLGYWASQYERHLPSEVDVKFYLCLTYGLWLSHVFGWLPVLSGSMRASRTIHKKLVQSVLGTTLRWLDTTPTSRVITRCTQDIRAIDGPFAQGIGWVVELSLIMVVKLGAVVVMTPVFLLFGLFIGLLGGWVGRIYMKAQLSVKREMSNAKAPVLGHFGAAIAGLTSIRAYGAEEGFKNESLDRIDRYTKSARMFYNLNRVCIRIDVIGSGFSAALAAYLVYGNSLERIDSYIKIKQEPKPTEGSQPPAYWPASGDLRVENLSARYSSVNVNAFRVTEVKRKRGRTAHSMYGVKADGLRDLLITTDETLIQFSRAKPIQRTFFLVRPWDRRLLGLPDFSEQLAFADEGESVGDLSESEPESEPESESESESESGSDDTDERSSNSPGEEKLSVDSDVHLRSLRLMVHLGQAFSALLVAQQHVGEYKRVASDQYIIAQVKDPASIDITMNIGTLDIL